MKIDELLHYYTSNIINYAFRLPVFECKFTDISLRNKVLVLFLSINYVYLCTDCLLKAAFHTRQQHLSDKTMKLQFSFFVKQKIMTFYYPTVQLDSIFIADLTMYSLQQASCCLSHVMSWYVDFEYFQWHDQWEECPFIISRNINPWRIKLNSFVSLNIALSCL